MFAFFAVVILVHDAYHTGDRDAMLLTIMMIMDCISCWHNQCNWKYRI